MRHGGIRMTPELSVAMVLYNSSASLSNCLRSLRAATATMNAEVIAVDNASPDDSAEIVARELPGARVLRATENRGYAAGVNAAFAEATGRYWLMLNPDVRVPDNGLTTLIRWMDDHQQLGAGSPDLYGDDGGWESPGRAAPSVVRSLLELSRLHRLLPRHSRGRILRGPYWSGGDQFGVGWIPGTAVIVRPAAAREGGPLREDLFMYGEDIEWCARLRQAGWQLGVCSKVRFQHATSSSARQTWSEEERQRRVASGIDAATRIMHGPVRARALAGITALALALEAHGPGRCDSHRAAVQTQAQIWRELAARR